MQLKMKVTEVKSREETITERGKPDAKKSFEDVTLEAVSGDAFEGSAAGMLRMTIDTVGLLGQLAVGQVKTVTIS